MFLQKFQKNTALEKSERSKLKESYSLMKRAIGLLNEDQEAAEAVLMSQIKLLELTNPKQLEKLKEYKFHFEVAGEPFFYMVKNGFFDQYLTKHPDWYNFITSKSCPSPYSLFINYANNISQKIPSFFDALEYLYKKRPELIHGRNKKDVYVINIMKKIPQAISIIEQIKLDQESSIKINKKRNIL